MNSTEFYLVHLYRNAFLFLRLGKASAMAWILFLIIVFFTFVLFKTSARWVYYGGEKWPQLRTNLHQLRWKRPQKNQSEEKFSLKYSNTPFWSRWLSVSPFRYIGWYHQHWRLIRKSLHCWKYAKRGSFCCPPFLSFKVRGDLNISQNLFLLFAPTSNFWLSNFSSSGSLSASQRYSAFSIISVLMRAND